MNNDKPSVKEWIKRFVFAIILGIFVYFLAIKIIFKPDFSQLLIVGQNIILNVGQPFLKFKAYLCIVYGLAPVVMVFLWWLFYKNNNLESYGNAELAKLETDSSGEVWKK